MVLRIILLTLSICLSGSSFAKSKKTITKRHKKVFRAAKRAFTKKNYNKTLSILKRNFDLKTTKTPSGALQLAAYSYENLKNYKSAQKIYSALIRTRFKTQNAKIMNNYLDNDNADDLPENIPMKLLFYYHQMIRNWTAIYKRDFERLEYWQIKRFKKEIHKYVEILSESDYDDDTVEKIMDDIEKLDRVKLDRAYRGNFFASVGFVSWKDIITLITPSAERMEIKSTTDGLNICGGYKRENAHMIMQASLCFANTSADVGNETSTISYFQKDVAVQMYSLMPSILWKPYQGETAVGITIPLSHRVGDFTVPDNHELENVTVSSYGYLLEFMWLWQPVSISLQIGKLQSFSSSYWGLNTIYEF